MAGRRACTRAARAGAVLLPVLALALIASFPARAQDIQGPGSAAGNPAPLNSGQRPFERKLPGDGLALAVSVEGFVFNRWGGPKLAPEDAAVASDMAQLNRIGFLDNLETLPYGYYGRLSGVEVSIGGRTAVTDAAGKYTINWIPPGDYSVSLAFDGWKPFGPAGTVQVREGSVARADFPLDPKSGTVSGTLRDAVTGLPILHPMLNGIPVPALVWAPGNQGVVGYPVDVADHGTKRYSLSVFAGSREVKVLAPGYASFSTRVAVTDGQGLSRDLSLDPLPASLQGQVYGGEGSTALVRIGGRTVTTDGAGRYQMENITPHVNLQVRVSRAGFRDTVADTVLVPGEMREKAFVLESEGLGVAALREVRGRVADIGTRRPLVGILVIERYNNLQIRACTDGQGMFTLMLDPSRTHNLDFVSDGYDPQRVIYVHREESGQDGLLPMDSRGSYYVNPGDPVVTLVPNPAYRAAAEFGCASNPPTPGESLDSSIANFPQTLRGTVKNAMSGQPVPDVAVEVLGNRVCTDSGGKYALGGVAPLGSPLVAMSFIRNGYRTENRNVTIHNAGANAMNGNDPEATNRIDVDLTPDRGSQVYQQGCVPTAAFGSVADDGYGEIRQETRFVVSDATTGIPVEHAAVVALQNDRRNAVRLCTGTDGAAVLKDASVALGGTTGVEVNLTVRRNGYRPLEAKLYPTAMQTSFLLALAPDARYQTLDDCTDQRLKIAAANRVGIVNPKAQRQGEVLQADKAPGGEIRLPQTVNPQVMLSGTLAGGRLNAEGVRISQAGAPLEAPIPVAALRKEPTAGEKSAAAAGSAAGAFRMKAAPPQIRAPEPDLELSSCRVSGADSVLPGAEVELAVEVRNVSGDPAPATPLRALISRDGRITVEDEEVALAKTTALAAGQGGRWPLRFRGPTKPGVYSFGACVGQVPGERNEGNNCSKAVTVTVVEPPKRRPENAGPARGAEKKALFPAGRSPGQLRR